MKIKEMCSKWNDMEEKLDKLSRGFTNLNLQDIKDKIKMFQTSLDLKADHKFVLS